MMKKKGKRMLIISMLLFAFCFISSYSTTALANTPATTEATTEDLQTRRFATVDTNNAIGPEAVWDKCSQAIRNYQQEIDIITNVLIAGFVIIAGIVFIINCIRLTTIESHPLARKQEYVSLLYNVIGVALLGGISFFAKFIIFLALDIK